MEFESFNLKIVLILTVGFTFASIFGYLTHRLKLSSIPGYLLAGFLIGPYSPGFVADLQVSEQLAEIGVILMMFGVGLHFRWEELVNVKNIAIPGAIGQTAVTALVTGLLVTSIGWSFEASIIFGLAVGVASTVVLVRVLSDNSLLNTPQGHIVVGWLIVEDLITVIALVLVPTIAGASSGDGFPLWHILGVIVFMVAKFILLALLIFTYGRRLIAYMLAKIIGTHSYELFTLTTLAITFVIAAGSSLLFGTSIALGAFIAGMVMGQTHVRRQVSANSMPLKDTFVVIFFLSVGMLFNPRSIFDHFYLFAGVLAIILLVKPAAAYLIVRAFKYPNKTALIISMALAQIGEFSFILAEEANKFRILPEGGYDVIVACSLISISINPLIFKAIQAFKPKKLLRGNE